MFKLNSLTSFAKFINLSFKNRLNQTIYMILLSALISVCLLPTTNSYLDFWIFLSIVSSVLSLTTIRLSNNSIYSPLTKHLSMNIDHVEAYHNLDYLEQKSQISSLYQEEFITAMENAHKKGYKTIKMSSHSWVLVKVALHVRVTTCYDVVFKETGLTKIPLEVLLLTSKKSRKSNPKAIWREAFKSRKQVKVVFKLKK